MGSGCSHSRQTHIRRLPLDTHLAEAISAVASDFRAVADLEEAATMADEPTYQRMATRDDDVEEEEEEMEEEDDYEYGAPSPGEGSADEGEVGDATTPSGAQLVSRFNGAETSEDSEVTTVPDRGNVSAFEMSSLGPVEDLDPDVFEHVERRFPHTNAVKQFIRCKFCNTDYAYNVRDLHMHKDTCPDYLRQQGLSRETVSVPADDDDTRMVDVEIIGEADNTAEQADGDASALQDQNESMVDNGVDVAEDEHAEDEGEDEETQMLEEERELTALVPDRIDMPSDEDEPRPKLKVKLPHRAETANEKSDESSRGGRYRGEIQSESEEEDGEPKSHERGDDAGGGDPNAEGTGGDRSVSPLTTTESNGKEDFRSTFRMFSDESGPHAECLACGKICSTRPSGMSTHRKKCSNTRGVAVSHDRPVTRDDKQALLQSITPKKKSTKRRFSGQELELLDDEGMSQPYESDADSRPGSPPLRRSKRLKSDTKPSDQEAATNDEEMVAEITATPDKPGPQTVSPPTVEESSLNEFDLVGDAARAKRMTCRHCKMEVAFAQDAGDKHLCECAAYKLANSGAAAASTPVAPAKNPKRGKMNERAPSRAIAVRGGDTAGGRSSPHVVAAQVDQLSINALLTMDHDAACAWIFGSKDNAEKMKRQYRTAPEIVRVSVARFRGLQSALADLDVKTLLEQTPRSTEISALVPSLASGANAYRCLSLNSVATAHSLYECGHLVVFRPPEVVARVFVRPLAAARNCGSFVSPEMHDAKLLCSRGPLALDWQLLKSDCFIVCFRGKNLLRTAPSPVKTPQRDYTAFSTATDVRDSVKVLLACTGVGSGVTSIAPPTGTAFDFDDQDDGDEEGGAGEEESGPTPPRGGGGRNRASSGKQMVVDAGAVVYLPAGTWFRVNTVDGGETMWLQIQLKTVSCGDIAVETVRQLTWADPQRYPLLDGSSGELRRLVATALRDLAAGLTELSPSEIVPDLLLGMDDASAVEKTCDGSGNVLTKAYAFDLTDGAGFQGGTHMRLLKGSMFRVNPLAVLMSVDELPEAAKTAVAVAAPAAAAAPHTSTPKKALNRKAKRAISLSPAAQGPIASPSGGVSATTAKVPGVYELDVGFGNESFQSRLKVSFRCSPAQQAVVDWIRSRDMGDPFHVSELMKVMSHYEDGPAGVETLKMLLRFLCAAGYVADVEVPL